jgi:hypothetical protein
MSTTSKITILTTLFLIAFHSKAETPKSIEPQILSYKCVKEKDQRQILTELDPGKASCQVTYTKHKKTEVIGSAKNSLRHCRILVKRVKGRLVAAGFNCTEI